MNQLKNISTLILIFLSTSFVHAQIKCVEFKDLDSLQKNHAKPTIVLIHTDWCKYCLAMQQSTFKNKEIIEVINNNFYFIQFNAEEKRDIKFLNKIYHFQPNGKNSGVHELAKFLGNKNEELIYPIVCFLNNLSQIEFQIQGFVSSKQMMYLIQKFQSN